MKTSRVSAQWGLPFRATGALTALTIDAPTMAPNTPTAASQVLRTLYVCGLDEVPSTSLALPKKHKKAAAKLAHANMLLGVSWENTWMTPVRLMNRVAEWQPAGQTYGVSQMLSVLNQASLSSLMGPTYERVGALEARVDQLEGQ